MFSSREGGKGLNEVPIEAQGWTGNFKDVYFKEMYPGMVAIYLKLVHLGSVMVLMGTS